MSVPEPSVPWWLALHFAIGLAGTWLARRYALHRGLLDHPGERRSHALPTPRGGGISIVIAMLVVLAWLGWREPGADHANQEGGNRQLPPCRHQTTA